MPAWTQPASTSFYLVPCYSSALDPGFKRAGMTTFTIYSSAPDPGFKRAGMTTFAI
jgi:hypothetical protein